MRDLTAAQWHLFDMSGAAGAAKRLNKAVRDAAEIPSMAAAKAHVFAALKAEARFGADDTICRDTALLFMRSAFIAMPAGMAE